MFFVYMIKDTKPQSSVKIGYSSDPVRRLGQIQTGSSKKLVIEAIILCKDRSSAHRLERLIHEKCRRFKTTKFEGEWFKYTGWNKKQVDKRVRECLEQLNTEDDHWGRFEKEPEPVRVSNRKKKRQEYRKNQYRESVKRARENAFEEGRKYQEEQERHDRRLNYDFKRFVL